MARVWAEVRSCSVFQDGERDRGRDAEAHAGWPLRSPRWRERTNLHTQTTIFTPVPPPSTTVRTPCARAFVELIPSEVRQHSSLLAARNPCRYVSCWGVCLPPCDSVVTTTSASQVGLVWLGDAAAAQCLDAGRSKLLPTNPLLTFNLAMDARCKIQNATAFCLDYTDIRSTSLAACGQGSLLLP